MKESSLLKKVENYYKSRGGVSLYFYPLAVLYAQNGNVEKALDILLDGLKRFPRYELALLKIAELLVGENKHEAALAYIDTLLTLNPCNAKANFMAGKIHEKLGNIREANEFCKRASMIDPLNYAPKENLEDTAGVEGSGSGRSQKTNDLDIPKIDLEGGNEDEDDIATIMLARLYEQQGYVEDAIATYRKVLAVDPDNREAKEAIIRLEEGNK